MFQVERFGEVRSFNTFEDARRFVRHEGDASRLWSYIGIAQTLYVACVKAVA